MAKPKVVYRQIATKPTPRTPPKPKPKGGAGGQGRKVL